MNGERTRAEALPALRKGIAGSIRNNFTAYGFSIMITATLGVASAKRGNPDTADVFLFIVGAAGAFVIVEAIASGGFKHGVRGEPTKVLALGAAFNLMSISVSVGCAALVALATGQLCWLFAPFAATLAYVIISGIELAIAEMIVEPD